MCRRSRDGGLRKINLRRGQIVYFCLHSSCAVIIRSGRYHHRGTNWYSSFSSLTRAAGFAIGSFIALCHQVIRPSVSSKVCRRWVDVFRSAAHMAIIWLYWRVCTDDSHDQMTMETWDICMSSAGGSRCHRGHLPVPVLPLRVFISVRTGKDHIPLLVGAEERRHNIQSVQFRRHSRPQILKSCSSIAICTQCQSTGPILHMPTKPTGSMPGSFRGQSGWVLVLIIKLPDRMTILSPASGRRKPLQQIPLSDCPAAAQR